MLPAWTADERLYLSRDKGEVLREGDPNVASLLCAKGTVVPGEVAKRYGLGPYAVEDAPADDVVTEAVGDDVVVTDDPAASETGPQGESGDSGKSTESTWREVVPETLGPGDGGEVPSILPQPEPTRPQRRK